MRTYACVLGSIVLAGLGGGCGPAAGSGAGSPDAATGGRPDGGAPPGGTDANDGCGGVANCYSVYAHSDHTLYLVDLNSKTLELVGPFNAPNNASGSEDVLTDLAVAPDSTIWAISETAIYTVSSSDGHVTKVGSLGTCGHKGVALTFTPGGKLYTGDFQGAICEIDTSQPAPVVKPPITLSDGMALAGDLVAVGDGTVFGTVYQMSDATRTEASNILAKIDLATGQVTQLGPSGYPKLFGTSFAHGMVMGFTHNGSGMVVEIDPMTGAATPFATFRDPMTNTAISFAGAGVNARVPFVP